MKFKFGKIIKGTPIGIVVGLSDLLCLHLIRKYSNINLKYSIFLAGTISTIISFIGNFKWTFNDSLNTSSKKNKFFKFFIMNIAIIYLSTLMTVFISENTNYLIKKYDINEDEFIIENKQLSHIGTILTRAFVNGIFFIISIFLMSYIF